MIYTNKQIFLISQQLNELYNTLSICLPAKINYYIYKNKKLIDDYVEILEESRNAIIQKYGEMISETEYQINSDKMKMANQELNEVLAIEIDLPVTYVKLSELMPYEFTPQQMEALFFMIKED